MAEAPERQRVDKWLWQARFFKSRSLAAEVASSGRLRLNGVHVKKAAQTVRPGDTLSFPQAEAMRVIRILAIGTRRGPAAEAQSLYEDQSPEPEPKSGRISRGPRPNRREREQISAMKRATLEYPGEGD